MPTQGCCSKRNTTMRKLTLAQLKQEPTFTALSDRQQAMVIAYLRAKEAGSVTPKVDAIYAAGYKPRSAQSARVLSYQYFAKPAIKDVLNLVLGLSPRELFDLDLQRAIDNPKVKPAAVAALRMRAELNVALFSPTALTT